MSNEIKITKTFDVIEEVRKLPVPKTIWKGIPEGAKGLLTGVGKTGKTTFAENLAICLSVGKKDFFGFPIEGNPRKVLFVNLEEKQQFWARRQAKQIDKLSESELSLFQENYCSIPKDFPEFINDEKDWNILHDYIVAVNPDVIIFDSLSHMCIGEIERSAVAQAFIQNFRRYVGDLNKTVIMIHHNVKGNSKAVEMDTIAGSRIITQEFEFAFGFANIPGSDDESYVSMVYNKHTQKENSTSYRYRFTNDGWVQNTGIVDKYTLYNDNVKVDYRINSDNKVLIYNYFLKQSKDSQDSQDSTVTTSELENHFVVTGTMSKQTMFSGIKTLIAEKKIVKQGKGEYLFIQTNENEKKYE